MYSIYCNRHYSNVTRIFPMLNKKSRVLFRQTVIFIPISGFKSFGCHWFIAPLWFQSLKNLFPESDYLVTVFHATGAQWGVTHYFRACDIEIISSRREKTWNPLHKIGNIQSIIFELTNDKIQTTNYNWKLLDSATTFDKIQFLN